MLMSWPEWMEFSLQFHHFLAIIAGSLVGLSLGLTGGGGAIFAVPLLVYGMGVDPREAITISLIAVGLTSFTGFLSRWRKGEVDLKTGFLFALSGMIGTPAGTWIANLIPETVLMLAFAGLMLIVAERMWKKATKPFVKDSLCQPTGHEEPDDQVTCQRSPSGQLILTSRCAALLLMVGVLTGVIAGLFGVGGGFVIIPALVLFSGMPIHKAVGTSLFVISLVSLSGVISQTFAGRTVDLEITLPFVLGGLAGVVAGQAFAKRLSGPALQKTFVVAIVLVATMVIVRNLTASI
ncbi:sulfite exporter TauE/SafE family protein [Planctopirus hydrillae]|nr:sulfite exporter TauE/SafE family protein [Planctopirus hydrillae]